MTAFEKILLPLLALLPGIMFIVGRVYLLKKTALYFRMIVDGVGCITLYRLFLYLKYLTEETYPTGFHIGVLGLFGVYTFFFTANYGQIDSLSDDREKEFRKYRVLSLVAPVIIIASAVAYGVLFPSLENIIVYAVLALIIAVSVYYHFKHLIFPDVAFGVIKCLRPFNAMALLYSVLTLSEFFWIGLGQQTILHVVMIAGAIVSTLMIPCVIMGMKKWTI